MYYLWEDVRIYEIELGILFEYLCIDCNRLLKIFRVNFGKNLTQSAEKMIVLEELCHMLLVHLGVNFCHFKIGFGVWCSGSVFLIHLSKKSLKILCSIFLFLFKHLVENNPLAQVHVGVP
jgi:hypothetical protein